MISLAVIEDFNKLKYQQALKQDRIGSCQLVPKMISLAVTRTAISSNIAP
jgi:hypothetical protein